MKKRVKGSLDEEINEILRVFLFTRRRMELTHAMYFCFKDKKLKRRTLIMLSEISVCYKLKKDKRMQF